MYDLLHPNTQNEFQKLISRYGESYDLLLGLAETMYNHSSLFGRDPNEAKSYLEKAVNYDPSNQEAYIHLADIAYNLKDNLSVREYQEAQDSNSYLWQQIVLKRKFLKNDLNTKDVIDIVNDPRMNTNQMLLNLKIMSDFKKVVDTIELAMKLIDNQEIKKVISPLVYLMKGQNFKFLTYQSEQIEYDSDYFRDFSLAFSAASLISDPEYLPFYSLYPELIENLDSVPNVNIPLQVPYGDILLPALANYFQAKLCLPANNENCVNSNFGKL